MSGRPAIALVASSLAFSLVLLDATVVNVALPAIREDLGAGVTELQWVVNAYTLALASLLLSAGALSDRFGGRRMALLGASLFAVASGAAAAAPSVATLVAAQVVLGIGAAALVPASLAMLTRAYPEPGRRARAVGVWASTSAAAFAAGPVLAGLLIEVIGWRAIFAVNLPFAAAVLVLVARGIAPAPAPVPAGGRPGLDLPGQAAAVVALAALTLGLIESGGSGWGSPLVLGALAVAVAAGTAFVAIERRAVSPMLPLALFRERAFTTSAAVGLLVSFALYAELFLVSLYLQDVRGLSALETGLAFLPQPILFALAGMPAGRAVARFGPRAPLAAGGVIAAAGALVLLAAGQHSPYGLLVLGMALFGAGAGAVIPAITTAVVSSVPQAQVGIASAALNASRQTGGVLGIAVLGGLVADGAFLAGMHLALGVAAATLLGAALLGTRLVPRRAPASTAAG
jgi:DHA2 family methylenomycin A resistance protein-like MFS transporter